MPYPALFKLFGWLMVVSTVGLLLTPWEWRHKFGTRVMPLVSQHMRLFALGAFVLGAFILNSVLMP